MGQTNYGSWDLKSVTIVGHPAIGGTVCHVRQNIITRQIQFCCMKKIVNSEL
jgi:hypothetical protein